MSRYDPYFRKALDRLAEGERLRHIPTSSLKDASAPRQACLDLRSNDYLGLSRHPKLAHRAAEWAARYGTGAGASRLVSGASHAHALVEARLAALKGTETALVFASGWQANASILAALLAFSREATGKEPDIFMDRLNHASLQFACQAAGTRQHRFRHNDMTHLEDALKKSANSRGLRFIVTESVFSMDGDCAPLASLRDLADRYDAFLYVDDAHATGILGEGGRGLACEVRPDLIIGTCGKALGTMGAFVAGSRVMCDWLINRCSGFIYSTAVAPPLLGAMDAALDLLPSMDAERTLVRRNAQRLRSRLHDAGIDTEASCTQIIPAIIGENGHTRAVAERLRQAHILTTAIRPPTVPSGTARLRLALNSGIGEGDIDMIASCLSSAIREIRSSG